jgi:hypothetical protein
MGVTIYFLTLAAVALLCSASAVKTSPAASSPSTSHNSPFAPTAGWTYFLEAQRAEVWPSCSYRFLSYPSPACNVANLWNGAGINQELTLVAVPGANMTFYLQASCGHFLSYPGSCDLHTVDLWPEAGVNQQWTFIPTGSGAPGEYFIIAQGRIGCSFHFMSFPVPCSTDSPDVVDLWDAAGPEQSWRLYPMASPSPVARLPVSTSCADPFVWESRSANASQPLHLLTCTGSTIPLNAASGELTLSTTFVSEGTCLAGSPAPWASLGQFWAPETTSLPNSTVNVMFVSSYQSDGSHRIGYVVAQKGAGPLRWDVYSPTRLQLSPGPQGDIDPHLFRDPNTGKTYLVWKSDDNRIGLQTTRIWIQEVLISPANGFVTQLAEPAVILDSTGLWWAAGFNGPWSTLVEGPEMVFRRPYYYLFFAAGQYCGAYSEGVARATSPTGPFEKMGAPLLSGGIAGTWNGAPLRGPGHATFVTDSNGRLFCIFAAHTNDAACNRFPFIVEIVFDQGWPLAKL